MTKVLQFPDLAFAVKVVRTGTGQSQRQLGKRMGVSRQYISKVERGIHDPTLGTVARFSKGLGVKPEGLVQIAESRRRAA